MIIINNQIKIEIIQEILYPMHFINKQDHNIYMLYKYIQLAREDQDHEYSDYYYNIKMYFMRKNKVYYTLCSY